MPERLVLLLATAFVIVLVSCLAKLPSGQVSQLPDGSSPLSDSSSIQLDEQELEETDVSSILQEANAHMVEATDGGVVDVAVVWEDGQRKVPAIPGISGFNVRAYYLSTGDPTGAFKFGQERRDETWASAMEARIFGELSQRRFPNLNSMHVECRQVSCAVLMVYPAENARSPIRNVSGSALGFENAESLGGWSTRTTQFQAVYLTDPIK